MSVFAFDLLLTYSHRIDDPSLTLISQKNLSLFFLFFAVEMAHNIYLFYFFKAVHHKAKSFELVYIIHACIVRNVL